ncbi:hypothetical protein [Kineococcus sp. SYSU DK005]|uniref:hypothetical protein n=1 Tax=Kineococcus sp. SYSU DK005 TaxID=3383126 RepID=UPI003D7CB97B
MTTPSQEPGSPAAAESPTENGYGNDTGFALEAEEADESTGPGSGADTSGDSSGDATSGQQPGEHSGS